MLLLCATWYFNGLGQYNYYEQVYVDRYFVACCDFYLLFRGVKWSSTQIPGHWAGAFDLAFDLILDLIGSFNVLASNLTTEPLGCWLGVIKRDLLLELWSFRRYSNLRSKYVLENMKSPIVRRECPRQLFSRCKIKCVVWGNIPQQTTFHWIALIHFS